MASSSTPSVPVPVQSETVLETEGSAGVEEPGQTASGHCSEELGYLQLTAAEIEAGLVGLESDLAYILEEAGVDRRWRGYIGSLGLLRLNAFAMLAPSEQQMSEVLRQDFGLDPKTGIKNRVQHALLLDAWDRCKKRVAAQASLAAEASAAGQQLILPKGTQLSMRRKYEAAFGEVPDSSYPAKDYLMDLLEQVEEGVYTAEELSSIASWESSRGQQEDVLLTVGTVKVRGSRKRASGPRPKSPEELRKLYRIMWTAWTVVRLKHPEQRALQGIGREPFEELLDYVLGERCWERSAVGKAISWEGLLTYETQMRKEAAKFVNRGRGNLAEGIRSSIKDANLRTEYYIEAVAMAGVKRARSPPADSARRASGDDDQNSAQKQKKKKGKGKGTKGKKPGAADERGDEARAAVRTARDKEKLKYTVDVGGRQVPVCLRFNRCEKCSDCRFEHVCLRCKGQHPLLDCKMAPTPK